MESSPTEKLWVIYLNNLPDLFWTLNKISHDQSQIWFIIGPSDWWLLYEFWSHEVPETLQVWLLFSKEVDDPHFTSFFIVHLLKQSKMKLHPKAVNKAMTNNKMDMGPRNQIATTHGQNLMFLSNQKPRLHWSNLAKFLNMQSQGVCFPQSKGICQRCGGTRG